MELRGPASFVAASILKPGGNSWAKKRAGMPVLEPASYLTVSNRSNAISMNVPAPHSRKENSLHVFEALS